MLNSVESDSVFSLIDFDQLSEFLKVVRYDACGKASNGNYQWDSMTQQLKEITESQNFDSIILAGASMGSVTALHFAVAHPELVKALILVTPPHAWESRQRIKSIYRKVASRAKPDYIPEFLKRLISLNQDPPEFYEEKFPGTRKKLQEFRLSFDPAYYSSIYMGGAASDLPDRKLIAALKIPTMIVACPNDENHPLENAQELNALISCSELVTVSCWEEYIHLQDKLKSFVESILPTTKS